jgi:hypothetical protein
MLLQDTKRLIVYGAGDIDRLALYVCYFTADILKNIHVVGGDSALTCH